MWERGVVTGKSPFSPQFSSRLILVPASASSELSRSLEQAKEKLKTMVVQKFGGEQGASWSR